MRIDDIDPLGRDHLSQLDDRRSQDLGGVRQLDYPRPAPALRSPDSEIQHVDPGGGKFRPHAPQERILLGIRGVDG